MDVTKSTFNNILPSLLNDIAECCCVALDLEFSGIFNNQNRKPVSDTASSTGRDLQSKYREVKEAAEKYQVLQIGLTFIKENVDEGTYTVRPYNFYLDPILDPKLGLERTWTYQSDAIGLLLKSGFRMEAPFTEGVVYISREEEKNAKARVLERNHRLASLDDIRLTDLDSQYTIFLQEARRLLDGFVNEVDTSFYVNIPGPELRSATPITITNFHKRLVHQLVRSEYPGLVSIGKSNFIHVIRYNQKREEKILEERLIHVRERIYRQMGFRWVVEAMIGGDLSKLPPRSFLSPDCEHSGSGQNVIAYSDRLQEKLKAKKLVMVGHNLFTDLVNFYSCFFGNLPDKVEEFLSIIHGLFPTVVDTKYLATFDCGSDLPSSTLEEIDEMFATKEMPVITVDPKYTKYIGRKVPHEAGYDSLVTARVFLRLVAHINTQQADAPSKDSSLNENQSVDKTRLHSSILRPSPAKYADKLMLSSISEEIKRKKSEPVLVSKLAFAHRTIYDTLDQLNDDGSDSSFCESSFENSTTFTTSGGDRMIEFKIEKGELLPRLDNEFWKIYGNKLRVFGTAERFCELTA